MLWKPIDTAPKDRRFLAYNPSSSKRDKVTIGYWCNIVEEGYWAAVGSGFTKMSFTHWTELPMPSEAELGINNQLVMDVL